MIPQSPTAPVTEQSAGSSWQVTLIGAVLIMVVGGIDWTIIEGTATSRQTPSDKGGEPIAAAPANGQPPAAIEQVIAQTQAPRVLAPVEQVQKEVPFTTVEQAEIDRFVRANGTDVRAKDREGKTLLHKAAERGSVAIVKFLVSRAFSKIVYGTNHVPSPAGRGLG